MKAFGYFLVLFVCVLLVAAAWQSFSKPVEVDPMQPWLAEPYKYHVLQGNIFANGSYAIARGTKLELPALWAKFADNPLAHAFVVKSDAVVVQTFPTAPSNESFVKAGESVSDYASFAGFDWPGFGDYATVPAEDLDACKTLCSNDAGCDFASYSPDKNCRKKHRVIDEAGTIVIIKTGKSNVFF